MKPPGTIRLMTWNIHGTFGLNPRFDLMRAIELIRGWSPDIIGLSMIFQFMAPDFARVIAALRAAGVTAHVTIGGHYASFAPATLFDIIPDLDTIVRFEGERTIVELAGAVAPLLSDLSDDDWAAISRTVEILGASA